MQRAIRVKGKQLKILYDLVTVKAEQTAVLSVGVQIRSLDNIREGSCMCGGSSQETCRFAGTEADLVLQVTRN